MKQLSIDLTDPAIGDLVEFDAYGKKRRGRCVSYYWSKTRQDYIKSLVLVEYWSNLNKAYALWTRSLCQLKALNVSKDPDKRNQQENLMARL